MLKGKFRPEKMVRKKMPDGRGMLAKLPERRKDDGLDAAAADKEYCDAIDKVAAVFGQPAEAREFDRRRAQAVHPDHRRLAGQEGLRLVRGGRGG